MYCVFVGLASFQTRQKCTLSSSSVLHGSRITFVLQSQWALFLFLPYITQCCREVCVQHTHTLSLVHWVRFYKPVSFCQTPSLQMCWGYCSQEYKWDKPSPTKSSARWPETRRLFEQWAALWEEIRLVHFDAFISPVGTNGKCVHWLFSGLCLHLLRFLWSCPVIVCCVARVRVADIWEAKEMILSCGCSLMKGRRPRPSCSIIHCSHCLTSARNFCNQI